MGTLITDAEHINGMIRDAGMISIKCRTLGGNLVVLSFDEKGEIEELINDDKTCRWNDLFKEVKPWNEDYVVREGVIYMVGIPPQAWHNDFFRKLAGSVCDCELIKVDDKTRLRERLDSARLLIQTTSLEWINKVIRIKINNKIFAVRMLEEICNCEDIHHQKLKYPRCGFDSESHLSESEFSDINSDEVESDIQLSGYVENSLLGANVQIEHNKEDEQLEESAGLPGKQVGVSGMNSKIPTNMWHKNSYFPIIM